MFDELLAGKMLTKKNMKITFHSCVSGIFGKKTQKQTIDFHFSKCLWMVWEKQQLALDAKITEPLIGPSEISQGDTERTESSRFLPHKLANNVNR